MLTEATVEQTFRKLFANPNRDASVFERAEELLEELRDESPLRHRLSMELDELREMAAGK